MAKSTIILEDEQILLIANEVVVEGALVVKAKGNGRIELLDMNGNSVVKINAGDIPRMSMIKRLELKSFTIILDEITLKTKDVEVVFFDAI